MPPKGERLTKEQIDVLTRWIQQGANWPETRRGARTVKSSHWAFNKPVKHAPPAVKDAAWVRNPIDSFILAAQEKQGLKPSPEADKYALIRRATLDLTGLPPTPAGGRAVRRRHVARRVRAADRPAARQPALRRALGAVWMDIARYADSAGYGSDPLRHTAWPYRDWVIKAFNRNMPYDQFTVEQLAGDLLPNPTRDQIIATGFHRNTMTNTEGGTDDEEWRVAAVKDRTNVTVQAWMGLTMGCAECHTHKYDPITQREYYSFFAFFNQTEDTDQPNESPTMPVPTAEQEQKQRETQGADRQGAGGDRRPGVARGEAGGVGEHRPRRERGLGRCSSPRRSTSSAGATLAEAAGRVDPRLGHARGERRLHDHRPDRPQGHHRLPHRSAARRQPARQGPRPRRRRELRAERLEGRRPARRAVAGQGPRAVRPPRADRARSG